jgi:uncharacterized membrane protein
MLAALALGMSVAGCDQAVNTDVGQSAEAGLTYVGATEDGTPVELFIEDGTYVVKLGEKVVSGGTATEAANGTWAFTSDSGAAFTAKASKDGLTLEGTITKEFDGEDFHELYPVEAPPRDGADYRVSLNTAAIHVFPSTARGYAKTDVKAHAVIITNSGNRPTGELTLAVSNALASGAFTLNKDTIPSIAAGAKATFTVKPALGLDADTYTAKVTVTGSNDISAAFNIRFTVNNAEGNEGEDEEAEGEEDEGEDEEDDGNGNEGEEDEDEEEDPKPAPVYGIDLSETETLVFDAATFGYKPLTAKTVTVTNSGNQPTGELTLAVSNTVPSGAFTLNKDAIPSIAVGATATFTVVPAGNLAVGTYTATVSVSGANGGTGAPIAAGFGVSFVVKPVPTYGIGLDVSGVYPFPDETFGYKPLTAKPVNITNTGNQPTGDLTLSVSDTVPPGAFGLNKDAIPSIPAEGTATFTVVPAGNLAVGTYTATVSVSGGGTGAPITATFVVSFEVKPVPAYGISLDAGGLDASGTYAFPDAILGYGALEAKTVSISNIGNQPTGGLTVSAGTDFEITAPANGTIASIPVNDHATFSVRPRTGLAARAAPYTATVTVSGGSADAPISAAFNVSFVVIATYGIDLSEPEPFPDAIFGYTTRAAKTVTVRNTGNQPTGGLTVSAGTDFEITAPANGTIASIPVNDHATFSVRPRTGLDAGTHTATVSVTGDNGISATFGVSFNVIAATYGVTLSGNGMAIGTGYTHTFGTVTLPNYTQPAALSVTLTNTGNQPTGDLSVALSGMTSSWTLPPASTLASIAAGATGSFSVRPKGDLAAGTHTATVSVSNANGGTGAPITASFGVSFTVKPVPVYAITLSGNGGGLGAAHNFGALTLPNYIPTALSVTVSNTGNQPTGNLSLALAGTDYTSFTLGARQIPDIAPGANALFTVAPASGQSVGNYAATVMVIGANIETRSFGVSFEVKPVPTYGISLSRTETLAFPDTTVGYAAHTPQTITITNTGNQPTGDLTLALTGAASEWNLAQSPVASIAAGGTGSFTIAPVHGLGIGSYSGTVAVIGDNGIGTLSFGVSFKVEAGTFANLLAYFTETGTPVSTSYNLPSGNETYTTVRNLTSTSGFVNLVIDGGGRVVTGNANRVTVGLGWTLTLRNITLKKIPFTVAAGGKLVLDTGAIVDDNAATGITVNDGTLEMKAGAFVKGSKASGILLNNAASRLTMTGGTVSGNSAVYGGGVKMDSGQFTMSGGLISANTATVGTNTPGGGGGVRVGTGTTFTMTGGEISGNTASANTPIDTYGNGGAGVFVAGTFTMSGTAKISGNNASHLNQADTCGGGVYVTGTFNMNGGTISGNSNTRIGGGVGVRGVFNMTGGEISGNNTLRGGGVALEYYAGGRFNMSGGIIKNHNVAQYGGGVFVSINNTFHMTGGDITANSAGSYGGGVYTSISDSLTGNPSIGSKVNDGRGSIYGNTPNNKGYN